MKALVKNDEEYYDYASKVILVRECGVGKTNITTRFTHNIFEKASNSTIGVEFAI